MPNWVYNWVGVSGTETDLTAFLEKAKQPYTSKHKGKRYQDEATGEWKYDADFEYEQVNAECFMFWNFIEPEDKEVYFSDAKGEKPEGYEDWTAEQKMAHDLKFSGNGWYDWNIRNWGTKWDANSPDVQEVCSDGKGNASVSITFDTAWSVPEPVFQAMVKQHPELDFDFESEEEQGWGVKFTSSDGDEGERSLIMTEEWDIPDSHADYVNRDREDSCVCNYNDDTDNWYADCPRPDNDFYVVVTKTYRVRTNTAENAWELAQDNGENLDDLMEIQEDETHIEVRGENGERLFPTLNDGEPKVKECEHHFVPVYKATENGQEFLNKQTCVRCDTELPLDKDPVED